MKKKAKCSIEWESFPNLCMSVSYTLGSESFLSSVSTDFWDSLIDILAIRGSSKSLYKMHIMENYYA